MTSRAVRVLGPILYATTSVALVGLTGRAFAAFDQSVPLLRLLDPRACLWLRGEPYVTLTLLVALAVAVRRKREPWILLAFGACFVFTTLDVLWFAGQMPKKVDFRPLYSLQSAARLVWHVAFCMLASLFLLWSARHERR